MSMMDMTAVFIAAILFLTRSQHVSSQCTTDMSITEDCSYLFERLSLRLWQKQPNEGNKNYENAQVD